MIARLRALVDDPSVRALAIARGISLAAAPILLWLLVTRIPLSSRGAYLIAVNFAALVTLFETGIGTIVVQFAVHARPSEVGEIRAVAGRWFGRASAVVALIALVPGTWMMWTRAPEAFVGAVIPWLILVAATVAGIRLAPLVCLHEGRGNAEDVQRMRAWQAAAVALALGVGLLRRRPMEAAMVAAVALAMTAAFFLQRAHPPLAAAGAPSERLARRYREEQGRSARVWIALWAAPQLLTPMVLALAGSRPAGEIGVHVAIALAPSVLSIAWLHARYPRMGALVASGALQTFDETARNAFKQVALVYAGASAAVLALPFLIEWLVPEIPANLLGEPMLACLLLGTFALVLFQGMLGWLRAFGDERFSFPVVVSCAAMVGGSAGGAAIGGAMGAAIGYAALAVLVTAILAAGFLRLRAQRLAGN
jgi:hypothetical protein